MYGKEKSWEVVVSIECLVTYMILCRLYVVRYAFVVLLETHTDEIFPRLMVLDNPGFTD